MLDLRFGVELVLLRCSCHEGDRDALTRRDVTRSDLMAGLKE